MSIGGEMRMDRITRSSFTQLSEDCGMSPRLLLGRLDTLSARMLPAARDLAAELNRECPSEVYAKIVSVIEQQIKALS